MRVTYRLADPIADIEFARTLHHVAYKDVVVRQFGVWDEAVQDKYFLDGWNKAPHELILLNDSPVGVLGTKRLEDHIFLAEIQILPEYRRLGIGTKVLKEQMELARNAGMSLRLQVLLKNRAKDLYLRLGFEEVLRTETHVIMEWKVR